MLGSGVDAEDCSESICAGVVLRSRVAIAAIGRGGVLMSAVLIIELVVTGLVVTGLVAIGLVAIVFVSIMSSSTGVERDGRLIDVHHRGLVVKTVR